MLEFMGDLMGLVYTHLEIIGAFLGLVYLYLEFRASIHLWVVGAIMPAIYIIVYFKEGIYAQSAIQLYYIMAAVYGWWVWRRQQRRPQQQPADTLSTTASTPEIRCIPATVFGRYVGLGAVLTIPIYFLLRPYNASPYVAIMDAFIAAQSVVAMWMLSKKFAEQWLLWLIVDITCVVFYIYLSLTTETSLYATALLYLLYSFLALVGYRKWRQLAAKK
jgi:nicotinamide mononucleotide transporter